MLIPFKHTKIPTYPCLKTKRPLLHCKLVLTGHNLEEIRVRALKNIVSKLEHGLLCEADLVQEKYLHIQLLEWFNFPSCPLQDKVVGLILRLSKVTVARFVWRKDALCIVSV